MDPVLLKQQAAFKARATQAVEMARKSATTSTSHSTYDAEASRKKKRKVYSDPQLAAKSLSDFNSKNPSAQSTSNAVNFGTMAKIVDYMKKRHLSSQQWALSLKEILEELQIYDLGKKSEAWLQESLPMNPRLTIDENGKYLFKPPYKIKGKNSLLALLKKYHVEGKGGILLSDLNECIPAAEKHIEALSNVVIDVHTMINKRKDHVYFYNDPATDYEVDEKFKSLWRNASVDHLDEKKIEEYLQKHGIDVMKDLAPKKVNAAPPKRKVPRRRANQKVHNEHLTDVLEDYST
uniref:Transcription initiation factor IIE subunit beta n=1 Tax=Setaria digitata TaxID=48799 RepID=A0A915PK06_9BILA